MNTASQSIGAARHVADLAKPEPSTVCRREVICTLMEARSVSREMRRGLSQVEVATRVSGAAPYGIGVMLSRLKEKELILCEEAAYERLLDHLAGPSGTCVQANRRTVIEHLRKMNMLADGIPVRTLKPSGTTPNVSHVLRVTEEIMKVSGQEILSRNRSKGIVNARFFAMWALRTVSGTSFSAIGEQFGGKDHTTVINAVSQVELKRSSDASDRSRTDRIVDESDLLGIRCNMELLLRQRRLRLIGGGEAR
jgi:hypothetical protein